MARITYLTELISKEDLLFWHSLDDPFSFAGDAAETLRDDYGDFSLSCPDTFPVWGNLPTGEQLITFDGTKKPLSGPGTGTLRHLFVIASYAGASFPGGADGYKGLVSQTAGAAGILAGDPGTNKFFDFSYPDSEYRKSGVLYAANNMLAPVSGVPELVELIVPGGIALTSLQIGQDRAFTARKWSGKIFSVVGYSEIKTGLELEKIRLYADLRARLWIALNKTLLFPRNLLIKGLPTYSRFYAPPLDFEKVTKSHTYEDESRTFNQTATLPPRRFEVGLDNLTAEQAQIWDAFWENVRLTKTFNFFDYRSGKTWTNVRAESYSRKHEGHLSRTKNSGLFNLVQYVFGYTDPIDDVPPEITLLTATLSTALDIGGTVADISDFVDLQLYVNGVIYGASITTATGAFSLPATVTDLEAGLNSFYVIGRDANGNEAQSNTIYYFAVPDPIAPGVPSGLTLSSFSTTSIHAVWEPASDEEAYGAESDDDYLVV